MDSEKAPLLHHTKEIVFRLPKLNKRPVIVIFFVTVFLSVTFLLYNSALRYDFQRHICYPQYNFSGKHQQNNIDYSNNSLISIKTLIQKGIAQNDSRIVKYIKENHLFPPSTLPYKLSSMKGDPGSGKYYNGQNLVVKKILKNMRNGFFVDVGAHDGEFISNTLSLERDFNWTGLLIEPSPVELPNLKSKHRKAWISDVCLSPLTVPSTFDYLHRIGYTIASKLKGKESAKELKKSKLYHIQCFPLFSILCAVGVTKIDYFSLDIEGVELKVLNTIPFDSVFIKVISVEFNMIPEGKLALESFMKTKGYIVAQKVYHDYIFVHKSLNYTIPNANATKGITG